MDLSSPSWWRDTAERIVRNLVQTLAPVIGAFLVGGKPVTPAAVGWAAATVVVFTFLKAAVNLTAAPGAPWYWVWTDRLGSAAVAALLATLPSDLASVDNWPALLLAAAGATFSSVIMLYFAPPSQNSLDLAA